jgi:hypothetical protein
VNHVALAITRDFVVELSSIANRFNGRQLHWGIAVVIAMLFRDVGH